MIVSLTGCVVQKGPLWAVIEVAGLGYWVQMPIGTLEQLPPVGGTVALHTHVIYREDAQLMFGFQKMQERDFFRTLVEKVSGVGPKLALALLSTFSFEALDEAIQTEDIEALSRCPGVGKKTAERLILELRDKRPKAILDKSHGGSPPASGLFGQAKGPVSNADQALSGLMSLGYSPKDAQKALDRALAIAVASQDPLAASFQEPSTEWLLKQALKQG